MGIQTGAVVVFTAVAVACSGCGSAERKPAKQTDSAVQATPQAVPSPSVRLTPYGDARPDQLRVISRFVDAALVYDSTTERSLAFLSRLGPLVTSQELGRLNRSDRTRLDWSSLVVRSERTHLKVTGVSLQSDQPQPTAVIEAIRTTTTDFATVRDLVEISVELEQSRDAWLISSATGGGL